MFKVEPLNIHAPAKELDWVPKPESTNGLKIFHHPWDVWRK